MAKIKPIKPNEVVKEKSKNVPDVVFEVFNQLITEKWDGDSALILQKDAVDLMVKKGLDSDDIYDKGWLDIEGVYRKAGWKVEYDKPGYCETYDAKFIFSRSSRRNSYYD